MSKERLLTVAVRLHDIGCFPHLKLLLTDLAHNEIVDCLTVLFCCQGIEITEEIFTLCEDLGIYSEAFTVQMHQDIRSLLMKEAIRRADTPYLTFLDFDDQTSQGGYKAALKVLEAHPEVVATFGKIELCECEMQGEDRVVLDRIKTFYTKEKHRYLHENQYPIHACVFRLSEKEILETYIDESLTRVEDYYFFAQLALLNPVIMLAPSVSMGVYYKYTQQLNTPMDEEWSRCVVVVKEKIGAMVESNEELRAYILGKGVVHYKVFRKNYRFLKRQPFYEALPFLKKVKLFWKHLYANTFWPLAVKLGRVK